MPKVLYDEDGNEVEVPTEEELTSLKEAEQKVATLEEETKKLVDEKKELEEGVNPNWKEVRDTNKQLKDKLEKLKEQGKEIDSDGNIVDVGQIDKDKLQEEVKSLAKSATVETLVNQKLKSVLDKLPDDKKEQVNEYYKALTAGKSVDINSVDDFIDASARAAGVQAPTDKVRQAYNASGGGNPIINSPISKSTLEMGSQFGVSEEDLEKGGKIDITK